MVVKNDGLPSFTVGQRNEFASKSVQHPDIRTLQEEAVICVCTNLEVHIFSQYFSANKGCSDIGVEPNPQTGKSSSLSGETESKAPAS